MKLVCIKYNVFYICTVESYGLALFQFLFVLSLEGKNTDCLWKVKSNRSALRPKIQLKCNDSPSVQSVKEEILLATWVKARFEREQSVTDSEHQSVWIILPLTGCSLYTPYSDSHHTQDGVKTRTMPSNTKPMWRWSNLHPYRRQTLYCCQQTEQDANEKLVEPFVAFVGCCCLKQETAADECQKFINLRIYIISETS